MTFKRDYKSFDFVLAALVLALLVFGVIMVGSAAYNNSEPLTRLFKMHIVWAATGFVIMLVVAFVDFEFICKFYLVFYGLTIALLLLTKLFGTETNSATRWLYLSDLGIRGTEVGIQPSEFTKIFMIIYMAKFIDKFRERMNNILVLALLVALAGVPIVMIAMQPSLSAALATGMILIIVLFTAKVSWKYILAAFLVLVPALLFLYYDLNNEPQIFLHRIMSDLQQNRIRVFLDPSLDPDVWFQSQRSIDAIRSGQLTGRGLFNNIVAVPYATNDFIFAVIGAELGFVGCVGVIVALFLVVIRCFRIAHHSEVYIGRILAAATGGMIALQTFLHICVTTGTMPNTGITLPFISSGGSSIWIMTAAVGLVLSVNMTRPKSMFED